MAACEEAGRVRSASARLATAWSVLLLALLVLLPTVAIRQEHQLLATYVLMAAGSVARLMVLTAGSDPSNASTALA